MQELNASGNLTASYTQGVDDDDPLAMYRGLAISYYHADGLGSIASLTNASGQLAASYVYDSLGNLTTSTGTVTNPFQFTAREFDAEDGLYYYRARYYNPGSGRFLSEDPSGFSGGMNMYPYVGNDPIDSVDPTGRFTTREHYEMTFDLARAIFGPYNGCWYWPYRVAEANAAVDDNDVATFGQKIKFLLGQGPGWRKGGQHFPTDPDLAQRLNQAFQSCDIDQLGGALHSVQDEFAHSGPYADPKLHYQSSRASYLGWVHGPPYSPVDSPGAADNFPLLNGAGEATATILRQYKAKCLKCCSGH